MINNKMKVGYSLNSILYHVEYRFNPGTFTFLSFMALSLLCLSTTVFTANDEGSAGWFLLPLLSLLIFLIYLQMQDQVKLVVRYEILFFLLFLLIGIVSGLLNHQTAWFHDYTILLASFLFIGLIISSQAYVSHRLYEHLSDAFFWMFVIFMVLAFYHFLANYIGAGNLGAKPYFIYGNSNYFGEALVTLSPFFIFKLNQRKSSFVQVFSLLLVLTTVLISGSRSALLAFVVIYFFQRLSITNVLLALGALLALIFIRIDAVLGRLLIYKISLLHMDWGFFGVGIDNFKNVYPEWQSAYFRAAPHSLREELLADNVFFCYNEFLQVCIEWGLLGFLLMVMMVLYVLSRKPGTASAYFSMYRQVFIAVTVIALTSKPLHSSLTLLLFIVSALSVISLSAEKVPLFRIRRLYLSGTALACALLILIPATWIYHWQEVERRASTMNEAQLLNEYIALYRHLNYNGNFMYTYGVRLLGAGNFKESSKVLYEARDKMSGLNYLIALGSAYEYAQEYQKAEYAYRQASFFVPNRFYPRYYLMMLYNGTKEYAKCDSIARVILNYPVKVASADVDQIQREARSILFGRSSDEPARPKP